MLNSNSSLAIQGYDRLEHPVQTISAINNNTISVNNTQCWQGFCTVADFGGNAIKTTGTAYLSSILSGSHTNNYTYVGTPNDNYLITLSKDAGISIVPKASLGTPFGLSYSDNNFTAYIGYTRQYAGYFSSSLFGGSSIYLGGQGKAFTGTGNASITGRMLASDGFDDGTILIHDGTITGGVDATFSGKGIFRNITAGNICYTNGTGCNSSLDMIYTNLAMLNQSNNFNLNNLTNITSITTTSLSALNITSPFDIQQYANGSGTPATSYDTGIGVNFFNNTQGNPWLCISGVGSGYGDTLPTRNCFGVDRYRRLYFNPTAGTVFGGAGLVTNGVLALGSNGAFTLSRASYTLGLASDYGVIYGGSAIGGKNAVRYINASKTYTNYGATNYTDPHFFVHAGDDTATGNKFIDIYYDSILNTAVVDAGNVTQNLTLNAKNVNLIGNAIISGNLTVKVPHWSGYDNSTQSFANTANAQVINISNNADYDAWMINVTNKQNLTFKEAGDYLCTISPEFFQNGGGSLVTFWIQKNGIDVPWSNSRYSMSNNEYHAPAIPYRFHIENPATDNIRFMWWSDSTSTQIYSSGALTLPTRPSIPGIILTCDKMSALT